MNPLPFDYTRGAIDFEGVIVSDGQADAPTVLVFHGMEGRSDAQVDFCRTLANLGVTGRWPSTCSAGRPPAAGPRLAPPR